VRPQVARSIQPLERRDRCLTLVVEKVVPHRASISAGIALRVVSVNVER
jgi:hypothetical protein